MGVTIINNFDKYKGFFDFIYINNVFEHVSDPGGILQNLSKCLNNKGLLFMSVPDTKELKTILEKEGLSHNLFQLLSPHQHINGFNNNSLITLGKNAGLKPLSMFDFLGMLNTSLDKKELKFLLKKAVKNSKYGTGLFFSPS
jgi:2-polyprenyl-3-methyl-5-hydroxy-6-metoxy-1,4-benzoquinol methylase